MGSAGKDNWSNIFNIIIVIDREKRKRYLIIK